MKSVIEISGPTAKIDINTNRERISELMSRLVTDDHFRAEINKNPPSALKDYGISLKEADIEILKKSQLTKILEGMAPPNETMGIAIAVIAVVVAIPGDSPKVEI